MASIKPVMAFLTNKGGVGKTTLAANLTREIEVRFTPSATGGTDIAVISNDSE
jgi:MinD superfamily P-loop ATPase